MKKTIQSTLQTMNEANKAIFDDLHIEVDHDPVNHPKHYVGAGGLEPIDAIESWGLDFHLANVLKYIVRAGKKNKDKEIEDLEKAKFYLERKINKLKNGK